MPKACWWWLFAAALASCPRAPAPPVSAPPEVAAPVSLDEVMRRTHFAFWPEAAGFAGGHDTYLARVDAQGLALHLGAEATPALRFGPTTLSRGEGEPVVLSETRRRHDGVLLRESAVATELLENTERGLEQSWRFERAPAGDGDLVVRVPVKEGGAATVTEAGLRFAGPGGAFTYGHGTWVDAGGRRTPIPATFSGGAIELRVPAGVLAQGGYPAVLDPLIAPELDVEPGTWLPAYGTQDQTAVAFNGSAYLVVWQDSRASASAYATRVALDGRVMDPWGIPLGLGNVTSRPAVASDGADFLVVVSDPNQLRGMRVSASGEVLDPSPLVYENSAYTLDQYTEFSDPVLTWTGTHYALVNLERRVELTTYNTRSVDLVGRLLLRTGEPTPRVELTRFEAGYTETLSAPQLAVGNNVLLVAYRHNTNVVRALRFGLDLTPLDVASVTVGTSAIAHSVAWDGQRFAVIWSSSAGLFASRVTLAGAAIDPVPLRFNSTGVSSFASASDPAGVTVLWVLPVNGVPTIFAARLAPSGAITNLGAPPVATSVAIPVQPVLARGSGAFLLVWRATIDSSFDIFGLRVSEQLTALDPGPVRLSGSSTRQQQLSLAWNGRHYLATWLDYRRSQQAVVAARLARDGTPLAPLATQLSANVQTITRPSVATNGDDWLVAWSQVLTSGYDVVGARVTSAGEPLDDAGVVLVAEPGDQMVPSVASLGDDYLVVFDDRVSSNPNSYDVRAVAVGRDGRPRADGGLVISAAPGEQSASRVAAWDGGAFVAWFDRRDGGHQIRGARVGQGPALLDPQGLFVAGGSSARGLPNVAAGPEGVVLCWTEYSPAAVMSARVDHAGVLRGTAQVHPRTPSDSCFATWDGSDYVVGWSQLRPGESSGGILAARWLSFDGGFEPDAGLILTPAPDASVPERLTAVASPGRRQVIFGFTAEVLPDAGYVARARTRVVTRGGPPVVGPASAATSEDLAVTVPLTATDPDGDAVIFLVGAQPDAGVAVAVDGGVTYQPAPDFHGTDRFVVRADDGALLSDPVVVEVVVSPVDDAPVAPALSLEVDEDTPASVPVPARDLDDEPLAFSVVEAPGHGTLAGQPPSVIYTPAADFTGTDTFTYALADGQGTSAAARVTVLVRPVADAPVAVAGTVTTMEDTPVEVSLAATDADGEVLTFEVLEAPAHGSLEGAAPALRYVPAADFSGDDRLVFRASDGTATATAEVRLVVTPVNDPPTTVDATLAAVAGVPLDFSLPGTDPEGGALSFRVLVAPAHGALEGEPPALTYTPAADFVGADELRYEVLDEGGASAGGTVRFSVAGAAQPPEPPPTSCGCGAAGVELLVALAALLGRRAAVTGRCR